VNAPVSSRETGIRVAVRSAADIFDFVDQIDRRAVGELVFRDIGKSKEVRGVVFIEAGRVCWAAARGLARRLTELLIARSPGMDATAMEELFRRCQQERAPLGEFLVARGIVQPAELRSALFQHTAESLDALCVNDVEAGWCLRSGRGYSPRFTFSTSELLAHTLARALSPTERAISADAESILPATFAPGEWGAGFVRGAGAMPSPIVVHGALPETTKDVLRVGKWAASVLDLSATFQEEDALVTSMEWPLEQRSPRAESVFVAWRLAIGSSHQAFIAGKMSPQGPARILNRRAQVRRTSE
jgi:hypothetical protein